LLHNIVGDTVFSVTEMITNLKRVGVPVLREVLWQDGDDGGADVRRRLDPYFIGEPRDAVPGAELHGATELLHHAVHQPVRFRQLVREPLHLRGHEHPLQERVPAVLPLPLHVDPVPVSDSDEENSETINPTTTERSTKRASSLVTSGYHLVTYQVISPYRISG
ncbi:hypothetical protein CEXT_511951, partial [Caerostris extrusa]